MNGLNDVVKARVEQRAVDARIGKMAEPGPRVRDFARSCDAEFSAARAGRPLGAQSGQVEGLGGVPPSTLVDRLLGRERALEHEIEARSEQDRRKIMIDEFFALCERNPETARMLEILHDLELFWNRW